MDTMKFDGWKATVIVAAIVAAFAAFAMWSFKTQLEMFQKTGLSQAADEKLEVISRNITEMKPKLEGFIADLVAVKKTAEEAKQVAGEAKRSVGDFDHRLAAVEKDVAQHGVILAGKADKGEQSTARKCGGCEALGLDSPAPKPAKKKPVHRAAVPPPVGEQPKMITISSDAPPFETKLPSGSTVFVVKEKVPTTAPVANASAKAEVVAPSAPPSPSVSASAEAKASADGASAIAKAEAKTPPKTAKQSIWLWHDPDATAQAPKPCVIESGVGKGLPPYCSDFKVVASNSGETKDEWLVRVGGGERPTDTGLYHRQK